MQDVSDAIALAKGKYRTTPGMDAKTA